MVGHLIWSGKRQFLRIQEENLMGLRCLRAELPGSGDNARAGRRWEKGIRLLALRGVESLLPPEGERLLPQKYEISTRELWRRFDVPVVLDILERAGAKKKKAVVGLADTRPSAGLLRRCRLLAPEVRGISLDLQEGREELEWLLQRDYGLPVFQGGGDVNLAFSDGFFLRGQTLDFYSTSPKLENYDLQGPELPGSAAHLPLLALLLREGKVKEKELRLIYNFDKNGHTDAEVINHV